MDKSTKEKEEKQKPIELNPGMAAQLIKKYGCSHLTIRKALNYEKNTPLHQAIRHDAKILVYEWMKEMGIEDNNID